MDTFDPRTWPKPHNDPSQLYVRCYSVQFSAKDHKFVTAQTYCIEPSGKQTRALHTVRTFTALGRNDDKIWNGGDGLLAIQLLEVANSILQSVRFRFLGEGYSYATVAPITEIVYRDGAPAIKIAYSDGFTFHKPPNG